jgi:hypothetical protein
LKDYHTAPIMPFNRDVGAERFVGRSFFGHGRLSHVPFPGVGHAILLYPNGNSPG